MNKINIDTYDRKSIYNSFKDRSIPFLSTTANVNVTNLIKFIKNYNHSFFITVSYFISKTINSIPQFKHRIVNGELFEFDIINPGYTVLLDDETFSFCDSHYFENFTKYSINAQRMIDKVKTNPDVDNKEKHDMFFITNIPWFSFTSIVHPYDENYKSIPIVSIGKFFKNGDEFIIPIGIQAHHGLVDGIHVGKFYKNISDMFNDPELGVADITKNREK
jgi:chloramphenicol O-acetyltransferase type A